MNRTLPCRTFLLLIVILLSTSLAIWRTGREARAQICDFSLSSPGGNFEAGGGQGSLVVAASGAACAWTAISNASWITIAEGPAGTGAGSVRYAVAANGTPLSRTGTLTIAGQTVTINQAARIDGLMFYPLAYPVRLLDTRSGFNGCDAPGAQIPGGTSRTQTVAGRTCSGLQIPAFAQAITGNITTVQSGGGFLTLYPSDSDRPLVANSNYDPDQILNNVFTVGLGAADGAFKIYVTSNTDVVIDVTGYYAPPGVGGLYFHPLPRPVRLLETRATTGGCYAPGAPLPGVTETVQQATGDCAGLTIPAAARAIVGNATTVNPQGTGYQFFTLFPANATRPLAASSNYLPGQIMNGPFTVGLSSAGAFRIYPTTQTDLVIDVSGYYSAEASDANGAGLLFSPLTRPVRLLETRPNFNGCYTTSAQLLAGSTRTQPARGVCANLTVPGDAAGIIGNATVVQPLGGGWLTFWPSDATKPTVAASNYTAGQIFNRHFIAGLGAVDGAFNLFTLATTHLVVDMSGYFAPPPPNQSPIAAAGADQTIAIADGARLTGLATDDGLPAGTLNTAWSKVSGPGTVTFSAPSLVATQATFSVQGVYVLRLTAGDSQLTAADDLTVTVGDGALAVNAGADRVVTLPNNGLLVGSVTGGTGTVLTAWSRISGPGPVLFSNANAAITAATFQADGVYVLRLTATDALTTLSDDVQVTVNPDPTPPPPDPMTVAPANDMTVATTIGAATAFLYTGANPIQTGVAPGTIEPRRAAVLKGRVLDKSNNPLPLVRVTVLDHPEFGQTLSRADGRFDMAVNGGGVLTVKYEKSGFLPVQRTESIPWQDYCGVPDVVMMGYDATVTMIDLLSNAPIQVAQSTINNDTSGARRTTLLFKQGTAALMKLPGGAMAGLDKVHVRATEYTVGTNGPNAMPGELPANSAYTYAVEFSIDEAVVAGAIETTFSQPVAQYNENFLNLPVGASVPSGAYDRQQGLWLPAANGRIVRILSVTGGLADLDVTGNGAPATAPEYAALEIDAAERQQLASLYTVNQSLWRVPIVHFSSWDFNFGFSPPSGGAPPNPGNPSSGGSGPSGGGDGGGNGGGGGGGGSKECKGCILGMEDQRLSEEIDVVGAGMFLRYDSTRPHGNLNNYLARIPLSGATLPGPLKQIELTVSIAGQQHFFTFPAQANQITSFAWDGKDAYGRDVQGRKELTIDIGNVYDGVYQNVANFGYNGNGVPISANTRQEVILHRVHRLQLGSFTAPPQSLGGWTLSAHHAYDPVGQKLYEGNGRQRDAQTVSNGIETFAGGLRGFAGDGGPVSGARFQSPRGVAAGPDGSVYIADSENQRVRRVSPAGIINTVAGNGGGCGPVNFPCGNGGPATSASIGAILRAIVGRDGSLYLSGDARVWRVTPDGVLHLIAGGALAGFSGDGGPALQARLSGFARAYPAPDGSVYISDQLNQRIRRVDPAGIITTIAGTGVQGFSGDGGPAASAQINYPGDLVAAPDGTVYFVDQDNNRIRRITPDGIISTFAGTGVYGSSPDGLPALQTNFILRAANTIISGALALGPDGSLYVISYVFPNGGRLRRIGPDGIVTGVAGSGAFGSQGDGGPALAAQMRLLAFGLAPDGSFYTVGGDAFDFDECRVRKISTPLPGFSAGQIAIPSADGARLFRFDAQGRHLDTVNALTGATVHAFAYDSAGRLVTMTDGDGNVTTIQRNGSGQPTGILSPYNQPTTFTLDANGFLATIRNPNNEQYQFTYSTGGLMLTTADPRGNQTQFTYDANGRLTRDDDAAGGFQALTRTGQEFDFTVTHDTALNRQTGFRVQTLGSLDRNRIVTFPEGTTETLLERASGLNTRTMPDGTVANLQLAGDPRWKLQAPFTASENIATPAALAYARTFARAVTLSNPADPLSLVALTETETVNGRIETRAYAPATRTWLRTSPAGRATTLTTDLQGRTTALQVGDLNATAFAYDTRGRLSTETHGSGPEARAAGFAYNAAGFLASMTDALGRVTGATHDAAGRVTQRMLPDGRNLGFGYDAKGNRTSVTPPGRPAHMFAYNAVDLPTSYTPPTVAGTGPTQFTYNLDRQITSITQPGGATIAVGYDAAGRLATRTIAAGIYTYSYNATTGTFSGIAAPNGPTLALASDGKLPLSQTWSGVIAGSVSQTFNNFFLPATQSVNGADTIAFAYDDDNLLTGAGALTIARNAQNGLITGTTLGGIAEAWSHNGFGELIGASASFNATPLYSLALTHDKLGRVTQKVETIGGSPATWDYLYDLAGRLREAKLNGATVRAYGYDSNGNRASLNGAAIGTYDAQDRMTAYGAATYSYTPNGELLAKTAGGQTTTYGYDAIGNLRTVTLPDATQIEYVIDGQDRRVGKKANGALTQGWLYQDQLEPVAELDGAGTLVSRFVYATHPHTPDYLIKGGVTYRILTDHLGSVRFVVNAATGVIAQRIDYDEFGAVLLDTNPGFQPFGFAGGLYDPQTKLTRFGARDYDAETGRWTAKDPLGFAGLDTNFYAYAMNDPVNRIDPDGLQSCPAHSKAEQEWEEFKKNHKNPTWEQYKAEVERLRKMYPPWERWGIGTSESYLRLVNDQQSYGMTHFQQAH